MLVAVMTAFSFASCEDVPAPYDLPTGGNGGNSAPEEVAEGDGTVDNPFNVAGANAFIEAGEGLDKYVYLKGKVSSVKECSAQYGNATFYISADGTTTASQFYVYRVKGLGNKSIASDDEVKVGDDVVVYAQLTNYNGTYETVQNSGYIYSQNGNGGSTPDTPSGVATGDGTKENPFNSVAANEYTSKLDADAKSDKPIYIKGKVVSVKEQYSTQFGNATFYISDDGKEANQFYVFRALYLGNEKYASGATLNPGDDVVVCGTVTNYKGNTPETVQGEAYLVELNSNGGTDNPDNPDTPVAGEGLTLDSTNGIVTMANTGVTEGDVFEATVESLNLEGDDSKGVTLSDITLSDGTVISFDGGNETNKPTYFKKYQAIRVYKNNGFTVKGAKKIAKIILTCDGAQYVGNATATLTFNGNNATYTNVYTEATGGGTQLRFKAIKIVYTK